MSQFAFLKSDFPDIHKTAVLVENHARTDPRGACFHGRFALENVMNWLYRHEGALQAPYEATLSAMIHHHSFRRLAGDAIIAKAKVIQKRGNAAAHDSREVRLDDAFAVARELWHISYWLVRKYGRGGLRDLPDFSIDALPNMAQIKASSLKQIMALAKARESEVAARQEAEEARLKSEEALQARDAEIAALQAEIAQIRAANEAAPDAHDYNEATTRDLLIDDLLHEAGWPLSEERDREFEVTGMPKTKPTSTGFGYVDYVLWGDDGKPLGLVEAKRTKRSEKDGQHQAKLYADCLEAMFGQRPVIFCSNGYKHLIWDDLDHPPREVQGFYKKDELELLIQRRTRRKKLADQDINTDIAGRPYQMRAIRRVGDTFEADNFRRALLVMATGTGKTRTTIALCDVLMRANWAKRILFLADRRTLVSQAYNAFKAHLPSATLATTNAGHDPAGGNDLYNSRILVATYPSMMGRIDKFDGDVRPFGPGHFDLIVVDEAHRSIYQKYGAIFDYFDAHIVGLTATPKDEVDRDTYKLFGAEAGVPTDAFSLDEAVEDGYLVPFVPYSVPTKFQLEGITYATLPEGEKDQWDALEWDEEGTVPDRIDSADLNKWLFNEDTVDKVLAHLMEHGIRVEDGDRLGKTIVFAKNNRHAEFIAERFNANYPHYKGHFAQVVTYKTDHAQSLIDDFSTEEKAPHIAISVDMLDTGIDVPEVVNLVFFKLVRSKTKFWQMIGRGTRLRENLFGPGEHKTEFAIFDFCQNFEFFDQHPDVKEARVPDSVSKRLFVKRLELVDALSAKKGGSSASGAVAEGREEFASEGDEALAEMRQGAADLLHGEVAAMTFDNFIVRPRREHVEPYQDRARWSYLSQDDLHTLAHQVAGLPSAREEDHIAAKQFDLLMIRAQLALLQADTAFAGLQERIREVAGELEALESIPQVREHMAIIQDIQTDSYWEGIMPPMLEGVRRKLRHLVQLIAPKARKIVYTDFEDEIGEAKPAPVGGSAVGTNMAKFRAKTRKFLEAHDDHLTIQKLRRSQPLTPTDLEELERIMRAEGVGSEEEFDRVDDEGGLGVFIRSLVGLDRAAAKEAFAEFLKPTRATANQIEFVNLIIDHLTRAGTLDVALLYEPPFTDKAPLGLDSVFDDDDAKVVVSLLRRINASAVPRVEGEELAAK